MKKIFFLLLYLFFISTSNAQRPSGNIPKINISGIVIDLETNQPLEYATISLINKKRPDRIQGGITDSLGAFNLEVPPGNYDVKIEFIGFEPYIQENTVIKEAKDFGRIKLKISENLLNEVELMAERTEVEIRLDKRIYNVGKDLTVRGGSVADVLDNVPSVSVDLEGNVALRGNDNVRILINGKPSGLVGISGPQGLQQLPAESIEKVEVVTSPSARYGAEGTAGIINIILRKQELLGFNGNFILNGGFPNIYGGSASLNLRKKKFNIFTTNSLNKSLSIGQIENSNEYFNGNDPSTFIDELRRPRRQNNSVFTNLGVEFYLKEKTSLILGGFVRRQDGDDHTRNLINELDSNKSILKQSEVNQVESDDDKAHQFNLNFDTEFDDKGQKLTAVFQYEENSENEFANINKTNRLKDEKVDEYQSERRILLQTDYVLPLDKDTQFEFGYRGDFSDQETDFRVFQKNDLNQFERNNQLSNVLVYKEYVNALYSQFGKKINAFSLLLGLRVEDSKITVDQRSISDFNQKNYTKFFPTVNLSYEFSETESIILGYSRRISRPRGRFLNPFPSRVNVANFFQGNADLDPSYSNTIDIGYLKRWDKFTFNTSVYYQKSTDVFNFVSFDSGETVIIGGENDNSNEEDDPAEIPVIRRSPINVAENNRTGVEFTVSYAPSRKSRFFANFNLFNSETIGEHEGGVSLDRTNLSWSTRLNSKVTLPGEIDWQMRAMYYGPNENAQSKYKPFLFVSGALSKDLFKKNATLSFRTSDLFNSAKRRAKTITPTFEQNTTFRRSIPTYIFSFTYRLNQKKEQRSGERSDRGGNGGGEPAF